MCGTVFNPSRRIIHGSPILIHFDDGSTFTPLTQTLINWLEFGAGISLNPYTNTFDHLSESKKVDQRQSE